MHRKNPVHFMESPMPKPDTKLTRWRVVSDCRKRRSRPGRAVISGTNPAGEARANWKRLMKLSIIAALIMVVTTCADAQRAITFEQMSQMARLMTGIQIEADNLNLMFEDLARDSVAISDPGIWDIYKSRLAKDTTHVSAVCLKHLSCKGAFEVFRCRDDRTNDAPEYIIALGYNGSVFPLEGFGKEYFERLVKSQITPIESPAKARQVAEFYLETVLFTNLRRTILSENDIKALALKLPSPIQSKVIANQMSFRVILVTKTESPISIESPEFYLHSFEIAPDGKIAYRGESVGLPRR